MTKTELIDSVSQKSGLDKKSTKAGIEGLTTVIENTIKKGGEVPLSGLGKFKVVKRKARMGRNPATGEPIKIAAKTVVKFSVAKNLKDLVKKAR
jgi:nucleoid DNA-binding protein